MNVTIEQNTYKVSFKQERSKLEENLPKEALKEYLDLFDRAKKEPKKVLPPLEALHRKYPRITEVANLLTFTYLLRRKIKKAEKLIELNYQNNPTDLFARINYADQCLRKKKAEKLPLIFNPHFDLKELYPNKEIFHSSEISGFTNLMSFYYLETGDLQKAKDYYTISVKVDPYAKSLNYLEKRLFSLSVNHKLKTFLLRIIKKVKIPIPKNETPLKKKLR